MKFVLAILLIFNVILLNKADFPTRQKFRNQFKAMDFKFDLNNFSFDDEAGGTIKPLDVNNMPALQGEGISYSLFNIEPCGVNLPHVHPRASELLYVIKGSNIVTSFVEENRGRTITNVLNTGEATLFPQGLLHFQQNMGCEMATYLSALNSEDPGVLTVSNRLFELQVNGVAVGLNMTVEQVLALRENVPRGPAAGQAECLRRCRSVFFGPLKDWIYSFFKYFSFFN